MRQQEEWIPVTKLGRLVKAGEVKSIEQVFTYSLPIKEHQIVDHLLPNLKEEVLKVWPVQKQTTAGQRTRFKAVVVVGDSNGHVGLGVKSSKEVPNAIKAAIVAAKLNIIPVRKGYWGAHLGDAHTVPCKVEGKVFCSLSARACACPSFPRQRAPGSSPATCQRRCCSSPGTPTATPPAPARPEP